MLCIYVIRVMWLPSFPLLIYILTVMRVIRVMHVKRIMGPTPRYPVKFVLRVMCVIHGMHDIRVMSSLSLLSNLF